MIKELVAILILCLPLVWELWNDRNGDLDKGRDVIIRCALFVVCALVAHYLTEHRLIVTFNLAGAIHWLLFDYLIHIILYRNGVIVSPEWFRYTGKSSKVDNISWWRNMNPWLKLIIRILYLAIALFLYIKL